MLTKYKFLSQKEVANRFRLLFCGCNFCKIEFSMILSIIMVQKNFCKESKFFNTMKIFMIKFSI